MKDLAEVVVHFTSRKSAGHILSAHHEEPRNETLCCTAQEQLINCHACELGIFGHILSRCIDGRVIETNCLRNYQIGRAHV